MRCYTLKAHEQAVPHGQSEAERSLPCVKGGGKSGFLLPEGLFAVFPKYAGSRYKSITQSSCGRQVLAAARSRRGSDMPPACHSTPRRRFAALYTREPLDNSSHLYFTRMNVHPGHASTSSGFTSFTHLPLKGKASPVLYSRMPCAAGALDMFFPGHVPGKNTTTREHFRRNAAKPPRGGKFVEGVPALADA